MILPMPSALRAVRACASLSSRRKTYEIGGELLWECHGDHVVITGTDGEMFMRAKVPMMGASNLSFTTPADKIAPLLASSEGEVRLTVKGSESLLSFGRSKHLMRGLDPSLFPEPPSPGKLNNVSVASGEFLLGVKQSSSVLAPSRAVDIRRNAYFHVRDNSFRLMCVDGYRMTLFTFGPCSAFPELAVHPASLDAFIGHISKEGDVKVHTNSEGNVAVFAWSHGDVELSFLTSTVAAKMIPYWKADSIQPAVSAEINRAEFLAVVNRIAISCEEWELGVCVQMTVRGNEIKFSAYPLLASEEFLTFDSLVSGDWDGRVQPSMLHGMASTCTSDVFRLELFEQHMMRVTDGTGWTCTAMTMLSVEEMSK